MKKAKKASGENIPEEQRNQMQIKLRLPPDVAWELDALAATWRLTRSGTVARLVQAEIDSRQARGNCTACNGAGRLGDGDGHYRNCSICNGTGNRERTKGSRKC